MDADPATLTEPERRVALLDWLARGRDIRIAAELCGEKHDWAKDIAKAAGHPDRDQIRQALAAAKAEVHPPRQQLLKPDSIAPVRPRIPRPTAEEMTAFAELASVELPNPLDEMTVEQIVELVGTEDGGDADLPEHTEGMDADDDEDDELPDPDPAEGPRCPDCGTADCQVIPYCTPGDADPDGPEHVIAAGTGDEKPARVFYEPAAPAATCQHDPRLVLEGRLWHAVCPACGTTWHRTRCTAPGCGAYVSAEYIARTGSTRHDWHPKEQS